MRNPEAPDTEAAQRALSERVNWDLLQRLAATPHKHLNVVDGERYGLMADGVFDTGNGGVGEVMQEARTVQHLCDMAGVPEGWADSAHIDARVFLLMLELFALRERLSRISSWHSRETAEGGMVGDFCADCGQVWPCETRRMADGTHEDLADPVMQNRCTEPGCPALVADAPGNRCGGPVDGGPQGCGELFCGEHLIHTCQYGDLCKADYGHVADHPTAECCGVEASDE